MKHLLTLPFLLLTFTLLAQEPEFKVASFSHEANSMLARINKNVRLDDNDEACALILVRSAETGLGFTSNTGILGNVDWKSGDYWVYVSEGARSLKIFKKGIKTIEYTLEIIPKSRETYLLELEVIRHEPKNVVLPVTIITTPENTNLSIDGKSVGSQTKTHQLSKGTHTIILEMPGYETLQKTITINENSAYFNLKLNEVSNAGLMIESDPAGADVYLDGVKLGQTPISAFYPPGTYPVRIIKEGFITIENQNLTVTTPQTRKKYTLEENVGHITINSYETAKVYINDTEYPNTKNIKLLPQLLTIKVSMPKAEALEKQVILKRNDSLSIDMYPDTEMGSIQVAITPFDAQIELTGDADEHFTAIGMKIFKDIPVGNYTIKISAEGYSTVTKTVTLTANQVLNQNIKLEKGSSGNNEVVAAVGNSFTDIRDGKTYKTVKIGTQIWMAENLNYSTNDSWCYDNQEIICNKYGRLYNWEAAKKICPTGWHLPSDDEWKQLEMELGMSKKQAKKTDWRGVDQGEKMQSTSDWKNIYGKGTNSSGFNALPGGICIRIDSFSLLDSYGYWWSSSEASGTGAWYRYLGYDTDQVGRRGYIKTVGFSVRCLQN